MFTSEMIFTITWGGFYEFPLHLFTTLWARCCAELLMRATSTTGNGFELFAG